MSGEEVEPESDDNEDIAAKVDKLDIGDDEEGWSTEGEDTEDAELAGEVEKKLTEGQTVPLQEVAREVAETAAEGDEHPRTRVLSVTELEDLFIGSAPPLSGTSNVLRESASDPELIIRIRHATRSYPYQTCRRTRRVPQRR